MSLRSSVWISFGRSGGSFVLQFISSIALARLLLPSEIGIYSVSMAAIGVLQALREFGVGRYIVQTPELTEDRLRTAFGTAIVIGWSLAAAVFFGRHLVADFYSEPGIAHILALLSINFLLLPFGQPAMAVMRRERRFGQSTAVSLGSSMVGIVVSITAAALGEGPVSMAYGAIAGSLTTTILALTFQRDHILLLPGLSEWRDIWRFGAVASGSNVVVSLAAAAPDLLIGRLLGFAPVGIYSRGLSLAMIFERVFSGSLNWVVGPELASMRRDGRKLTALVTTTTDVTVAIGWPVLIFLAFNADAVISLLYGEKWMAVVPVLQFLCVARGVQMFVTSAPAVYEGTGAVKLQLRNEIIIQVISVSMILLGALYSLEAVAALRIVTATCVVMIHLTVFRMYAHIGLRHLLVSLWRPAVMALAFAALQLLMSIVKPAVPSNSWEAMAEIVVEGIVSAAWYILLMKMVGHPVYEEIKAMFSSLMRRSGMGPRVSNEQ